MQKFGLTKEDRDAGRRFPLLSDRQNIVVIADEAHRTQYDLIDGLARNLRDAIPNAAFIGFTGTPIEAADRNTRAIFGEYIDVYHLSQAVEDGATVRVYYEARLAKVELPEEARVALDVGFEDVTELAEVETREKLRPTGHGSRRSLAPKSGWPRSPPTSSSTGRSAERSSPARR
jgi:type I restriction enzyme, R subunit